MNPYWGKNFFTFFLEIAYRLLGWIRGEATELASDEIQCLTLIGIAISSALVGSLLYFRKMTMLANALSHTILLGIVLTFLAMRLLHPGTPFEISIPLMFLASFLTAWMTTFFTYFLKEKFFLQEDASISLVFSALFALGIVFVTIFTRSAHLGVEIVMGNVDALHVNDLKLVGFILLLNLFLFLLFFKEYQLTTFDPGLAKAFVFHRFFSIICLCFKPLGL
jgi:manganese/zinc/iron transport system permease protein